MQLFPYSWSVPVILIPMAKQYKQIFFDLDHTLWDFETNSHETLHDLYKEMKLDEKATNDFEHFHQTYHHHNAIYWDRFRKGYINREELRWKRMWRTLVDYKITDEQLSKAMSERYLEILPTKTHLFPDCIEVLTYLRDKSYPMHLITNGFETTQQLKIKNSKIDVFFKEMITSEQAGIMKPHVAIFEYALSKTNAAADSSIMIGDTLEVDILGANNAGIDSAYFNPAQPPTAAIQPTYILGSLIDLKNIL
jgi:putative hydrolase of the HAD superfamily